MIFNTFAYYLLFLIPAAILFRVSSAHTRPWVCASFGIGFFAYFSATQFGGWWGVACLLVFLWEATFRSFYRPRAWAEWHFLGVRRFARVVVGRVCVAG